MVAIASPLGILRTESSDVMILSEPCLFNPRVTSGPSNKLAPISNQLDLSRDDEYSHPSRSDDDQSSREARRAPRRKRLVSDASSNDESSSQSSFYRAEKKPKEGSQSSKNGTGIYFNNVEFPRSEKSSSGVYFNDEETNCVLHPLQTIKSGPIASPKSKILPSGRPLLPAPTLLSGWTKPIRRTKASSATFKQQPQRQPGRADKRSSSADPQDNSILAAALALSALGHSG